MAGQPTAPGRPAATDYTVSRAAEDKLTFKLGLSAEVKCRDLIDAYNSCVEGRTVTMFLCRSAYATSQQCIQEYVNKSNIETVKRRWVDAGRPQFPDWHKILEGVVAPEHVVLGALKREHG